MKEYLNKWKDKIAHFFVGMSVSIITMIFGYFIFGWFTFGQTPIIAFILAALAGAIKEVVIDKWMKKGVPSWADFWATVVGGFFGSFMVDLYVMSQY